VLLDGGRVSPEPPTKRSTQNSPPPPRETARPDARGSPIPARGPVRPTSSARPSTRPHETTETRCSVCSEMMISSVSQQRQPAADQHRDTANSGQRSGRDHAQESQPQLDGSAETQPAHLSDAVVRCHPQPRREDPSPTRTRSQPSREDVRLERRLTPAPRWSRSDGPACRTRATGGRPRITPPDRYRGRARRRKHPLAANREIFASRQEHRRRSQPRSSLLPARSGGARGLYRCLIAWNATGPFAQDACTR